MKPNFYKRAFIVAGLVIAFVVLRGCFVNADAAVETTTVQGMVVLPDGQVATKGSLRIQISTSGSTPDTATAQNQVVSGRFTTQIGVDGSVSFALVPNDAITPSGTFYFVSYSVKSPIRASWKEKWSVATSPDPVDIGAITKLEVAPGITVGSFVLFVAVAPSGACTGADTPRITNDTNLYYECESSVWTKKSIFDQDADYSLISGDWFFGGDVDMLSSTGVKIAQLEEPGQDLEMQFNSPAERKIHITNIGTGDGNLGVVGDITIDQSATATDAILDFKTSGAGTVSVRLDDSTRDMDTKFNDTGGPTSGHRWHIVRNIGDGFTGADQNGGLWPEGFRVGDSEYKDGTKKDCSDDDINRGFLCTADSDCHATANCSVTTGTSCAWLGGATAGDCPITESCNGNADGSCDAATSEWIPSTLAVNEGSWPSLLVSNQPQMFLSRKTDSNLNFDLRRLNQNAGTAAFRIVDVHSNKIMSSFSGTPHQIPRFGVKTLVESPWGLIEMSGYTSADDDVLLAVTGNPISAPVMPNHSLWWITQKASNVTHRGPSNSPSIPIDTCDTITNALSFEWQWWTEGTSFYFPGDADNAEENPFTLRLENRDDGCSGASFDGTTTNDPFEIELIDSGLGYSSFTKILGVTGHGGINYKASSTIPPKCKDGDTFFDTNGGAPQLCCCDPTQDGDGVYEKCDGSGTECS